MRSFPRSASDSTTPAHPRIREWEDAERFAEDLLPALSPGVEARHYELVARQLLAASAWCVAQDGDGSVSFDALEAVVSLEVDVVAAGSRPLDRCRDPRVSAAVAAVRERGRAWAAVSGPERNCSAWIAQTALRHATDLQQEMTTTSSNRV